MDTTSTQWRFREGDQVIAADGAKIGKVVGVESTYLVVEKGWLFPHDYYIPTSAVTNYGDGEIYLGLTKDEALHQDWDHVPTYQTGGTVATDATYAGRERSAATDTGAGTWTGADAGTASAAAMGTSDVAAGETIRVPVHEEELTATKRPVERGQVRVDKDVVAEERTLEVPVTEERAFVQRRVVDREAAPDATAFQEQTIEIPVRGEEVDVQKRTRVAEEVEIGKERVGRTERVADTVRREEVHVDDAGLTEPVTGKELPPA